MSHEWFRLSKLLGQGVGVELRSFIFQSSYVVR